MKFPKKRQSQDAAAQATEQPAKKKLRTTVKAVLFAALATLGAVILAAGVCCAFLYRTTKPFVTVELGDVTPEAGVFLRGDGEASYVTSPESEYPIGNYVLQIRVNGHPRLVMLRVRDTIPPAAEGAETTVSTKASPKPDKLLKNITDQSIVKLTFEVAPKYGTVGDYTAIVRMEDQSGNDTRVPVKVHVRIARDSITREAGADAPDAAAFLIDDYDDGMIGPITEQMMRTPGIYPIEITADGITTESHLIVTDTVSPTGRAVLKIVEPDTALSPEDFVADIADETEVTVEYLDEPDPDSRETQTVRVQLEDLGGNKTVVESQLLYTNIAPVEIEARTSELEPYECLTNVAYTEASFDRAFIPDEPGTHMLHMTIDGEENLAIVEVKDTVAPLLRVRKTVWFLNAPKDASFFATAEDITATRLRFESEPDWEKESQDVTLIAVDAGGNETRETFTLKLNPDVAAPTIYGARNRYSYVNEAVAYMKDISAEDECDGEVAVTVDTSKVNPEKLGTYSVTYTATDRAGNTASKTVKFTFVESKVTEEEAEAVAQEILKKVLKDGMTLGEQVEALYNYVFKNVHYINSSNKKDWRSEAVRGLTTGYGDCFTSYACLRLLLEHTGAELMSVERYGGRTHHYWMLVNLGSGWYHVDACNTGKAKKRCFMWTNAQKDKVSKTFWRFNESLYPPIATEPYKKGK